MKLICRLLLAILLATEAVPSHAQNQEPGVFMYTGTGGLSCGKFIEYKQDENQVQLNLFVQWVWGFLAAYSIRANFVDKWQGPSKSGNLTSMPESATVLLYIEKYCHDHPLDNVMFSAMSLTKALGGNVVGIGK